MFPEKREEIVAPNSPVSAGSAVGRQQLLLNPIDNGAGIYLKKPANVMSRVDSFSFRLCHGIVIEIYFVIGSRP